MQKVHVLRMGLWRHSNCQKEPVSGNYNGGEY